MTHFRSLLFGELQRIDLRLAALGRQEVAPTTAEEPDALRRLRGRCLDALVRMNERSFGECVSCNGAIPLERLVAEPWVERCVGCAARAAVPSRDMRPGDEAYS